MALVMSYVTFWVQAMQGLGKSYGGGDGDDHVDGDDDSNSDVGNDVDDGGCNDDDDKDNDGNDEMMMVIEHVGCNGSSNDVCQVQD